MPNDQTTTNTGETSTEATTEQVQSSETTNQEQTSAEETTTTSTQDSGSTDLGSETSEQDGTTDLGSEESGDDAESGEDETDPYADFRGPPEANYEDFNLPDGLPADNELRERFEPLFKKLGLSQAGAQEVVNAKAELDQIQMERWMKHVGDLKKQAQAHPEIGGANYSKAINSGRQVIAKFGTPGLRKMMNDYGVGAHPEMIAFMHKIGQAVGETPVLDNGGNAVVQDKPLHEILYKDTK